MCTKGYQLSTSRAATWDPCLPRLRRNGLARWLNGEPNLAEDDQLYPTKDTNLGYHINEPEGTRILGGEGPPRKCYEFPRLCSPGRWPRRRDTDEDTQMVCLDPGDRDQEGRPERRRPSAWLVEARTAASWLET